MPAGSCSPSGSGNKLRKTSSSSPIRILNKTLDKDFTDDIWYEICLYLPIKSIFKFRCVSKVWINFLSEPNFINKWFQINTPSPWALFYSCHQKPIQHTYLDSHSELFSSHDGFNFKFLKHRLLVLGVSNGLVLYSNLAMSDYYYVCNPLTKKWVLLPPPPEASPWSPWCVTAFICDVLQTPASYKVVRIPDFEVDSNTFDIEIFSSELGTWNVHQVLCPQVVTWAASIHSNAIIINKGVLYWIEGKNRMVAYNLGSNTCRLIDLPGDGDIRKFRYQTKSGMKLSKIPNRCLGEAQGLICFAQIDMKKTLSVWVLEEEKWHMLHKDVASRAISTKIEIKLRLRNIQVPPDGIDARKIQVLGISPEDKNVVILGSFSYVLAYNILTGAYEELCHPFFVRDKIVPSDNKYRFMYLPFVLKPTPTILPPPCWTDPIVGI